MWIGKSPCSFSFSPSSLPPSWRTAPKRARNCRKKCHATLVQCKSVMFYMGYICSLYTAFTHNLTLKRLRATGSAFLLVGVGVWVEFRTQNKPFSSSGRSSTLNSSHTAFFRHSAISSISTSYYKMKIGEEG